MEKQITFVSANEGNLHFVVGPFGTDNDEIKKATTIAEAAKIIQDHEFANHTYFSSSMDYADEYGFANHGDAHEMLESAVAVAYA